MTFRRGIVPAAALLACIVSAAVSHDAQRPRFGDVTRVGEGETMLILVPCLGLPGSALYYACGDVNGLCLYRRQDVSLVVDVEG